MTTLKSQYTTVKTGNRMVSILPWLMNTAECYHRKPWIQDCTFQNIYRPILGVFATAIICYNLCLCFTPISTANNICLHYTVKSYISITMSNNNHTLFVRPKVATINGGYKYTKYIYFDMSKFGFMAPVASAQRHSHLHHRITRVYWQLCDDFANLYMVITICAWLWVTLLRNSKHIPE